MTGAPPSMSSASTQPSITCGRCQKNLSSPSLTFRQNKLECLYPEKFFQSSLISIGKSMGQCYKTLFVRDLWIVLISYSVCQTRLEKFARDKHSSLLRKSVHHGRKKFYNIGTRSRLSSQGNTRCRTDASLTEKNLLGTNGPAQFVSATTEKRVYHTDTRSLGTNDDWVQTRVSNPTGSQSTTSKSMELRVLWAAVPLCPTS